MLLVDEEVDRLLYYTAVFQDSGGEVRPCPSYRKAAEWFGREKLDLVIISPGNHAFALARAIEAAQGVSVLILAPSTDTTDHLEPAQIGDLEKHLTPSEVAELVANHFGPKSMKSAV